MQSDIIINIFIFNVDLHVQVVLSFRTQKARNEFLKDRFFSIFCTHACLTIFVLICDMLIMTFKICNFSFPTFGFSLLAGIDFTCAFSWPLLIK